MIAGSVLHRQRRGAIPAGSAVGDPGWAGVRCRDVGRGVQGRESGPRGDPMVPCPASGMGCRALLSELSYCSSTVAVPC